MERVNETNFFAACDDLKKKYHCKINNIFMNSQELSRKFANQICHFHRANSSVFLLLPSHGDMQAMYFISVDPETFAKDLPSFISQAEQFSSIRTSVIGKEETCKSIIQPLENKRFVIIKKLLRMRNGASSDKIFSAMRILAANYIDNTQFAEYRDAEEILSLLCEEFSIVGDNIPTLEEIKDNIEKRNVAIVRINDKIGAIHYFHVEKGIAHGYFEVTRKEFRGGDGLLFSLYIFEHDYFKRMGTKINRSYGWREATKTRLVKSSSQLNSFHDGVVIYNMLWRHNLDNENKEGIFL